MDVLTTYAPIFDLVHVIATVMLAVIAFLYSRKATRMNFILQSTDMLNGVNSEFLSSDKNLQALAELRNTPSQDVRRDYLMLNNLNYLHAIWSLKQEHAISPALADAKLENGAAFWIDAKEAYIHSMLARGYPDAFQRDMKERIARKKAHNLS